MKDYWVGVFFGFLMACILSMVLVIVMTSRIDLLSVEINHLSDRQVEVEKQTAEHERIMKTYEFFNKTWEKLYTMEEKK